ncbi:hypothetical protein Syun_016493 [Stephania yunnanensis]|uniref:DYW domain-containing protein n=1 Tax=Stephania yunnanensis TaxID=152371 RepID=A0AAP0J7L0_9MAGN
MPERTLVSWTMLMSGYARHGPVFETLSMFRKMIGSVRLQPDSVVYAIVLRACAALGNVCYGRELHCRILKSGDGVIDSFVENALVTMYASSGFIFDSIRVFDGISRPDLVSWSSMLSGYAQNGLEEEGLRHFVRMIEAGVQPDVFVLSMFISACANLGCLDAGVQVHCNSIKMGFGHSLFLQNCLIDFYARCGDCGSSEKVFYQLPRKDLVSYNAIISGYVHSFCDFEALRVFQGLFSEGLSCDDFTLVGVLQAVIGLGALNHGREIHGYIIRAGLGTQAQAYLVKRGLICDPSTGNALIEMYSECGMIADAVSTFDSMQEKNSESWTSIISANVNHGHPSKAMDLFTQMCRNHKSLKSGTFTSILRACAQMGLVHEAICLLFSMREIYGIEPSLEHQTCIVEVLGRAGMFEEAQKFINSVIPLKSVPQVWKSLLSTSRVHGNMKVAKFATKNILALESKDFAANSLFQHFLLSEGKWNEALNLKRKKKTVAANSAWIEIRNRIHEFAAFDSPTEDIHTKLMEIQHDMKELGYVADKKHSLHNAEEEFYGYGGYHTEMKALALGLLELDPGAPIRVLKSARMCGDCHSAFKFVSNLLGRELVVKDTCNFHHFINGKCSCRDAW